MNKETYNKTRVFYYNGDVSERKGALNTADSFARRNYDDNARKFSSYSMMFFKESAESNLENIKKNPKDLDDVYAEQHDLMLIFSWLDSNKPTITEMKDGEVIVKDGQIIIKDVEKRQ